MNKINTIIKTLTLITFGALYGADPNWEGSFDGGAYEFSATLANATVSIDGIDSPTGKVAAFVGDEVRGVDSDGA